jgi:hypothetical protein
MFLALISTLGRAEPSPSSFPEGESRPVLGIVIGAPTGLSIGWALSTRFLVQLHGGVTAGDLSPVATLDVCYRLPEVLGGKAVPFVVYTGLGLQANGKPLGPGPSRAYDPIAVRVPFGIEVLGSSLPLLGQSGRTRLFAEVAPGIGLVEENRAVLSAAIGLRL